jgi:CheY-like chemotaxis protein
VAAPGDDDQGRGNTLDYGRRERLLRPCLEHQGGPRPPSRSKGGPAGASQPSCASTASYGPDTGDRPDGHDFKAYLKPEAIAAGAVSYLMKPCLPEDLAREVSARLAVRRARTAVAL